MRTVRVYCQGVQSAARDIDGGEERDIFAVKILKFLLVCSRTSAEWLGFDPADRIGHFAIDRVVVNMKLAVAVEAAGCDDMISIWRVGGREHASGHSREFANQVRIVTDLSWCDAEDAIRLHDAVGTTDDDTQLTIGAHGAADGRTESRSDMEQVTEKAPEASHWDDLVFANKCVKHLKSNAIALAKGKQLIGMGCGQTSRVDALKQAIAKARAFDFDPKGSAMASDAFFPFADSVELAHQAGVMAVVQPGGSIRDKDSIAYCNAHGLAMVFTGVRHFRH